MKSDFSIDEIKRKHGFFPSGVIFIRGISRCEKKMLKIDFENHTWEVIHKKNDAKKVMRYAVCDYHYSAIQSFLDLESLSWFRNLSQEELTKDLRFSNARTVKNFTFSEENTNYFSYTYVLFYPGKTANGDIGFVLEDPLTKALGYIKEHDKDIYRARIG